jgi:prolyl-tRNA synthetase
MRDIASRQQNHSKWYVDVVTKTELADYAPGSLSGFMVIRPYGFALWENMKNELDRRFKETGHQNACFPVLIPESLLKKEAENFEGFKPQVAWVTHGGDKELAERLSIRPTSETIICEMYSKWIKTWRDLPLLINQWANIIRWEIGGTKLFIRTREFLWQEGHTVHRTEEEAEEETLKMLEVYRDFVETELAIPVVTGRKTEKEKFAGALRTYTIEALMFDGYALQAGTSHNLGQNFAKAFNIRFLDQNQELQFAWQTSWGVSTRLVGAIVMTHGDDDGLILPPNVAPIQVVIIPIILANTKEQVLQASQEIRARLAQNFRVHIDYRDEYKPGWKFNEWEMKGVPIRLEIGPRDLNANQVTLYRRDTREKILVKLNQLQETVEKLLQEVQYNLFKRAKQFQEDNTHEVITFDEFQEAVKKGGFINAFWCGNHECEDAVKKETKATIRCIPLDAQSENGNCVYCGNSAEKRVYFARAY